MKIYKSGGHRLFENARPQDAHPISDPLHQRSMPCIAGSCQKRHGMKWHSRYNAIYGIDHLCKDIFTSKTSMSLRIMAHARRM